MSIWFVTPAWQRFEITAICLEQRRRMIDKLNSWGHEAYSVVVADDDNLDTAQKFGFSTVKTNNDWLGRKFNDGIEYALQHGATWVVPIGSDSWLDPWYLRELPPEVPDVVRTSELYSPVERDRLALLRVGGDANPAGPHCFHRDLLARRKGRPMPDRINRNTDSNTLKALRPFRWQKNDVQPLQYIGFRVKPYITEYEALWRAWGQVEHEQPWQMLKRYYDADLVDRAQAVMS
jgi:hypothetical protein